MSTKSPLAGLLGAVVALGPLPYYEAAQLLDGFSDEEKLVLYACLGGAPQYLALVDSRLTLLENLEQLYLRPSGFFYNATLLLLKPISGSGGLALGQDIMRTCGVDSVQGRTAAVMLGASETSLYTISVYCGYLGLKKTRYAIPAALLADFAAFVCAAWFVRILY